MKYFSVFILLFTTLSLYSQDVQSWNLKKGFVAEGYDVVSYFDQEAKAGRNKYKYEYQGAKYRFANQKNLEKFKQEPDKYTPQYGGWCAYAMAVSGDKVDINPKTFEIRDGKLYLFYNKLFTNTLTSWEKEEPKALVLKADKNWAAKE